MSWCLWGEEPIREVGRCHVEEGCGIAKRLGGRAPRAGEQLCEGSEAGMASCTAMQVSDGGWGRGQCQVTGVDAGQWGWLSELSELSIHYLYKLFLGLQGQVNCLELSVR